MKLRFFFNKTYSLIIFFLTAILSFNSTAFAQYNIKGIIIDSVTGEPLPFVNIVINDGKEGGISDLDGKFQISSSKPISSIKTSYVGYESRSIEIGNEHQLNIKLKRSVIELSEVVILPGENLAHRIINNAVNNIKSNNPHSLNSFSYTAYNRFHVTADTEILKTDTSHIDSSDVKLISFFDKQYIFLMESITKNKFLRPSLAEENVIDTKVAGFHNPIFTLLMSQIQSFAFYEDIISISDKNYVNPISKGSSEKYLFLLKDTLYDGNDSIYIISFRPLKNTQFDGLEGLVYIHTDRWAIQNVIATPSRDEKGLSIKIQQQYARIGEDKQWFPTQLSTDIIFKNIQASKLELVGNSRTYLNDILINPSLKRRHFGTADIIFTPQTHKTDTLWNDFRSQFGTKKDSITYAMLDSLSKEHNLDKTASKLVYLFSGNIPIAFMQVPISSLFTFNDFEGWRLGLSAETNHKISNFFSLGGGFAYGLKDKQWKYHGFAKYNNNRWRDFTAKISYSKDVQESGHRFFINEQLGFLTPATFRNYLITMMDNIEKISLDLNFIPIRNIYAAIQLSDNRIDINDKYLYKKNKEVNSFLTRNITLSAKHDPNIFNISGLPNQLHIKTAQANKPILQLQYSQSIPYLSDFNFQQIDFSYQQYFPSKYYGQSNITIQLGYTTPDSPYPFLSKLPASYRNFGIYVPQSFQTVRMNEFITDKYAFLFYKHTFGKLLFRSKYISPHISVAGNAGIGTISHYEYHLNRNIKAPEKGIFEAGIIVDELLNVSLYSFGL